MQIVIVTLPLSTMRWLPCDLWWALFLWLLAQCTVAQVWFEGVYIWQTPCGNLSCGPRPTLNVSCTGGSYSPGAFCDIKSVNSFCNNDCCCPPGSASSIAPAIVAPNYCQSDNSHLHFCTTPSSDNLGEFGGFYQLNNDGSCHTKNFISRTCVCYPCFYVVS